MADTKAEELDLSPPNVLTEPEELERYLFENFSRVQSILEDLDAGVDGTFTTVDGKTVTVTNGIITSIV